MRGTTSLKKADGAGKSEEDRTLEGRRRQTVAVFALRIGKEGIFYYNFPHNMCARCRTKRKPNRDVWERLCSSSGRRFNCGQDMHKCS